MIDLKPGQFAEFFQALHDKPPFPWQQKLSEEVCSGSWPRTIDLPTASGKTACIDIAIFSLAVLGSQAPRRIFFIVDRRVIVQEAFDRATKIADKLAKALVNPDGSGILHAVARNLHELAGGGDAHPLDCYELRGGAYRDESWADSPLQPTVLASTVDQIGSRLLFRGYGVSDKNLPIHAGLIAHDSILFLDEAHCSKPFGQTVSAVARYLKPEWASTPLHLPFRFVEMTATPSTEGGEEPFRISENDRSNEVLRERLRASKPTSLKEVKDRKNEFHTRAAELANEAIRLAREAEATRAVIMVNRVQTAKLVHEKLKALGHDPLLVIGRMRPYDRDQLAQKYKPFKTGEPRIPGPTTFVVSTQCLEVGADLDFDVLVTECASVDALVQRFGRLDRIGEFKRARASILKGSWQDEKNPDAVYGAALAETWKWLQELSAEGPLDFAIENDSASTVAQRLKQLAPERRDKLRLETADAPVLLPAHLDALVQTNPRPEPEPAVELFLHGPHNRVADVQVVWREDLGDDETQWAEIASFCPPTSREAMPVAFGTFMKWLAGDESDAEQSDIDGHETVPEQSKDSKAKRGLIWRNGKPELPRSLKSVRPGETVILPVAETEWEFFGHIPPDAPLDVADRTRFDLKREMTLRIHPKLLEENETARKLLKEIREDEWTANDFRENVGKSAEAFKEHVHPILQALGKLRRPELDQYPSENAWVFHGWVSHGDHEPKAVFLDQHLKDVAHEAAINGARVPTFAKALQQAAELHDYGKADVRFQTWLHAGDEMAARFSPKPLAKSGKSKLPKQTRYLPENFRHELLSLLFAQKSLTPESPDRDLVFHLIASHHGFCRPFAPVVVDTAPECLAFNGLKVCAGERLNFAPHRLGSGVSERFWSLTRQYGWWGLAYLEGLLRLADWKASGSEYGEVEE